MGNDLRISTEQNKQYTAHGNKMARFEGQNEVYAEVTRKV